MNYRTAIIGTLLLACLAQAGISFAADTSTTTVNKTDKLQLLVSHGISFDTTSTINDIRYPVNVYTNWNYKADTPINKYIDSNKIKQSVSSYLSSHTKNSGNLEALTRDLAYNMLDQYPQLQAFTITFNVLATSDRIVSDYSSVTASYHN